MIGKETKTSDNDIAIVGISVKFPQIDTLDDFRKVLQEGVQCISSCPEQRKGDIEDYLNYCNYDVSKRKYRQAGYFDEIDKFDYRFFNISPKEATLMDPTQRLLLETSFHALEDAGYTRKMLSKKKVGVFTGFPAEYSSKVYHNLIVDTNQKVESSLFSGNLPAILPARLSYFLDLQGPAVVIDTSCSSSLSALYFACQSMAGGDCEMAVVNGVNIFVYPIINDIVGSIGILSSDGKTKAFDERADGVGQGEGVVAIVIKYLHDAIENNDNIYAVIKSAAINQDGKSIGITAPNPTAQTEVIVQAWNKAGINPETISYIETHGTGTKLGDPTEITGINNAFRRYTNSRQMCAIGSVKTNLGHTLGAAGLAGIVKTSLQLFYGELYPICNLSQPNKRIDFLNSKVYINTEYRKWEESGIRRAGVSSFGITGTNCHVVLEEHRNFYNDTRSTESNEKLVFLVSAKDESTLIKYIKIYHDFFEKNKDIDFENACYSSCMRKEVYPYRVAILAKSMVELIEKMSILLETQKEFSGVYFSNNMPNASGINKQKNNTCDNLEDLCRKIAVGETVNFEVLYNKKVYKNIPLPGYPLKKDRVWISIAQKNNVNITDLYYPIWKEAENVNGTLDYKTLVISQIAEIHKLNADFKKHGFDTDLFIVNEIGNLANIEKYLETYRIKQVIYIIDELTNKTYIQQIFVFFKMIRLIEKKCKERVRLIVALQKAAKISNYEELNPYTSLIIGALKTIIWEFTKIDPHCIDVDVLDNKFWIKEVKKQINEFIICYRGRKRYIEYIKKIDKEHLRSEGVFLREGGVYVIVGGNGRIGRKLARFMAESEKIKLVILCRTDEEASRKLWDSCDPSVDQVQYTKYSEFKEIESKAISLAFKVVDICDQTQVQTVLNEITKAYGPISGVVQAAVDDNGDTINNLSLDTLEKSIMAKVQGTMNIGNSLKKMEKIDFLVLFSSVMTLISGPGNATYTMANSFLNSYQSYLNDLGINTYTINWPEWQDIGLDKKLMTSEDKSIFKKIMVRNAVECFKTIVENRLSQVYIGEVNSDSILWKHLDSLPFQFQDDECSAQNFETGNKVQSEEIIILGRKSGDYTESEKMLAKLYEKFMGYREVDINENFFNLGGDSIFAMKIAAELQDNGIEVEGVDIMRYQTILEIGKFIDGKYKGGE